VQDGLRAGGIGGSRALDLLLLTTFSGMVVLAVQWFEMPVFALLLFLPPVLAGLWASWTASALVWAAMAALLLWAPGVTAAVSEANTVRVAGVMALLATVVWMLSRDFAAELSQTWQRAEYAQHLVDEARSQRLELRQVEEDLPQANREQIRLLNRLEALNQIAEEGGARPSRRSLPMSAMSCAPPEHGHCLCRTDYADTASVQPTPACSAAGRHECHSAQQPAPVSSGRRCAGYESDRDRANGVEQGVGLDGRSRRNGDGNGPSTLSGQKSAPAT
jgi:type II secretory pathway pseudopilin PulG